MFETLIYTYIGPCDFRDAVNADGIAESSHKNWILQFNAECHRMCQSLDELIKSRPLHLYQIAIWTGYCKYHAANVTQNFKGIHGNPSK